LDSTQAPVVTVVNGYPKINLAEIRLPDKFYALCLQSNLDLTQPFHDKICTRDQILNVRNTFVSACHEITLKWDPFNLLKESLTL
jgi:hypothetical protein